MRQPKYMSPTSLKIFESDREEYYINYLADNRPPRAPQTQPMSVGSAFDSFVKSYLYEKLVGQNAEYEKQAIFEAQVEEHNRDWAQEAGQTVFDAYKSSGALVDLMTELKTSINEPRFEFSVQGTIDGTLCSVPLLGKPDIFFMNDRGARVIFDWKVNGYCSGRLTSPKKGYVKVRGNCRNNGLPHKDCYPELYKGIRINKHEYIENVDKDWAAQLSIYSWLLGEEPGSLDLVIGIDQICGPKDNIRVASHRLRASSEYQLDLLFRLQKAWECIDSGYIFTDLSREESDKKCAHLDKVGEALSENPDMLDIMR